MAVRPPRPVPMTLFSFEAVPTAIAVFGQSELQMVLGRSDGFSGRERATITLTTTLGALDARTVTTNADGVAVTRLRGDGTAGTAVVTARLSDGLTAEVSIQIGGAATRCRRPCGAGSDHLLRKLDHLDSGEQRRRLGETRRTPAPELEPGSPGCSKPDDRRKRRREHGVFRQPGPDRYGGDLSSGRGQR